MAIGRLWGGYGDVRDSSEIRQKIYGRFQDKDYALNIHTHYPEDSGRGAAGRYLCSVCVYRLAMDWLWGGYGEAMGRLWEAMYVLL